MLHSRNRRAFLLHVERSTLVYPSPLFCIAQHCAWVFAGLSLSNLNFVNTTLVVGKLNQLIFSTLFNPPIAPVGASLFSRWH